MTAFEKIDQGRLWKFSGDPGYKRAIYELERLNAGQSNKNPYQRLKDYQRYSKKLLEAHYTQWEVLQESIQVTEELASGMAENAGKRWTEEADDALVEMATRDGENLVTLAGAFGRSPGAISARLTELVGMKRITGEQYLKVSGQLNGVPVEGVFHGTTERIA